jgi:hypothetical protein
VDVGRSRSGCERTGSRKRMSLILSVVCVVALLVMIDFEKKNLENNSI